MTEQEKPNNTNKSLVVPRPFRRAVYAAVMFGGGSLVFGVPPEYAPRIALAGVVYSAWQSWQDDAPRKRAERKDMIAVNWGTGKMGRFEQVAPAYITRQSLWADIAGLLRKPGPPQMRSPVTPSVSRPDTLREFAFTSYDRSNNEVQILASELWQFLNRAWLYRERGRGLSERFWGHRGRRSWPQWYPGPFFYEACLRLIIQAQRGMGVQLVVSMGHQQIGLKWSAKKTYDHVIAWYIDKVSNHKRWM